MCSCLGGIPLGRSRSRQPGNPQTLPAWVPQSPVEGLPRFVLGPAAGTTAFSPWFALPADDRAGLFVTGTPGPSDTLRIEWGAP